MQGVVLFAIVMVNGFIALSETALVSSRRIRLQRMYEEGRKGADIAISLADSPTRFLASMQICLTVLGIMAGVHGGATMAADVEHWVRLAVPDLADWAHAVGMTAVIAFETVLMVFLGELLPKRLALMAPEAIAVRVAPAMARIGRTLFPAANVLSGLTDAILARLPLSGEKFDSHTVTEDELKLIVEQGAEEGVLDRNEESMIKRVLQFGDIKAEDLMTPRTKVIGLDIDEDPKAILAKVVESGHSYFPVYRTSLDTLIGVVSLRKIFETYSKIGEISVKQCMSDPLFLPDSARADRVLSSMNKHGTNMAILIDEFGGMAGVVTATDIVEAVMGDVPQQSGDLSRNFVERSDGSVLIDGMVSLVEMSEQYGLDVSPFLGVVQTISGLVMHLAKEIPMEGHVVEFEGWVFEVVDKDGNRIDKILAKKRIPEQVEDENKLNENINC